MPSVEAASKKLQTPINMLHYVISYGMKDAQRLVTLLHRLI
jgi:hypothetical protein